MGLFGGIKRQKAHYDTYRRQGKEDYAYGGDLFLRSVNELDQLDTDFMGQIAGGGLTPDMEREFDVARGRVADDVVRSKRGFGADLVQAARRTGGTIDPNTAIAYQLERDGQLDEAQFGAENEISFARAQARMERTDALYRNIMAIRERKGALSQAERDRAAQMWLAAMNGKGNFMVGLAGIAMGGMQAAAGGVGGGGPSGGYTYGGSK